MMVASEIQQALNWPNNAIWTSIAGGNISRSFKVEWEEQCFFVKVASPSRAAHFAAEAHSLKALGHTDKVAVPKVLQLERTQHHACLVMEYYPLRIQGDSQLLGEQLAALHLNEVNNEQVGWESDNYIGYHLQPNGWHPHWGNFFAEHRLGYQFSLAQKQGIYFYRIDDLLSLVADQLPHPPKLALLHGDLWSGNVGYLTTGAPIFYDPASYVGDPEVDLAMTQLFGGFSDQFYLAYHKRIPVRPGYEQRRWIYNLYHLLNHLNMFGSSYLPSVKEAMAHIQEA